MRLLGAFGKKSYECVHLFITETQTVSQIVPNLRLFSAKNIQACYFHYHINKTNNFFLKALFIHITPILLRFISSLLALTGNTPIDNC